MKKFTKQILTALLAILLPAAAWAQQVDQNDIVPGFFGHPLLKSNGYEALNGAFDLELLGSGAAGNLDKMVDANPDNATQAVNILGATVAYDQIVKVMPKDYKTVEAFKAGDRIGFLVSEATNGFSVLSLDVIKMMAIDLLDYKGERLKAIVAKEDEDFAILGVSLVGVGDGKQKIIVEIPADLDGQVYGIALCTAGVDAQVVHDINIHYAFVDDFIEVPIIRKYYPNATGSASGMTTGSKNLVNNNLEDGASTAVLTIGGTYYTVLANQRDENGQLIPFPQGIEAGWVITSGSALNLELGGAIQVIGITKDGEEVTLLTQVKVVDLGLASGGKQRITFMTPYTTEDNPEPAELIGFKLNRINVLDLDLGATLVHYAYVKLPEYPKREIAFDAKIEAVPYSEIKSGGTGDPSRNGIYQVAGSMKPHLRNDHSSKIYLVNGPENPLMLPDKSTNGIWQTKDITVGGLKNTVQAVTLVVTRKTVYADGSEADKIVRYYELHMTGNSTNYLAKNTLYYHRDDDVSINTGWHKIDINEDGSINFNQLAFEDSKNELRIYGKDADDSSINVVGYEYRLYCYDARETPVLDMLDDELDMSSVSVPGYLIDWEIAGTVNNIDASDNIFNHNNSSQNANTGSNGRWNDIKNDKYRHYISWTVPDNIDEKTCMKSVTLYKYYYLSGDIGKTIIYRKPVQTYTRQTNEKGTTTGWKDESVSGNSNYLGYINMNGITKLVCMIFDEDDEEELDTQFGLEVTLKLRDEYVANLIKEHGGSEADYNPSLDYSWYWTGRPTYEMPTLSHVKTVRSIGAYTTLHSTWAVNLNDAAEKHINPLTSGWVDRSDKIRNVEILYNQWSNLYNVASRSRAIADITEQNVVLNTTDADQMDNIDISSVNATYEGSEKDLQPVLYTNVTIDNSLLNDQNTTQYNAETRAYIPVVPSGFQTRGLSDAIQTYLVVDTENEKINISDLGLSGVENVVMAGEGESYEYYNIQGIKVENPESGIYLRRAADGTVTKVLVK